MIVTATDGAACAYGLKQLAQGLADEDALGLVMEIAQRKFTHFAQDWRRVSSVRVVAKAGWATVEATTFQQVRGASR